VILGAANLVPAFFHLIRIEMAIGEAISYGLTDGPAWPAGLTGSRRVLGKTRRDIDSPPSDAMLLVSLTTVVVVPLLESTM